MYAFHRKPALARSDSLLCAKYSQIGSDTKQEHIDQRRERLYAKDLNLERSSFVFDHYADVFHSETAYQQQLCVCVCERTHVLSLFVN